MPPACSTLAKAGPRLPSTPPSALAIGASTKRRTETFARSARIEVTRSRMPSLPVFTNSPTASSAPRKPLTSASPMPWPVSFALSA